MGMRPIRASDIWEVGARMRKSDREEVTSAHGICPLVALTLSVEATDLGWTFTHNDQPVAILGVAADPEKPGRTRDDWHLVVNIMHGYGLGLTDEEANLITDLLYDLRRGIEREPG